MNRFTRRSAVVALAVAIAVTASLSGCGAISNSSATTSKSGFKLAGYIQDRIKAGKPMRIDLSFGDPSIAIAVPFKAGMEQAGKKFGAQVQMIGAAGGDASKQVDQIETLIQQKSIDALGVQTASSDAVKPAIDEAYAAGIPVISFNTDSPKSKEMGFVGQDLKTVAKYFGEQLVKALGKNASGNVVAFSGDASAGWSQDRVAGIKEALAGTKLTLVGPTTTTFEPGQAYNTVQSTMAGKTDVAAVIGVDCCGAPIAAQWETQAGKSGIPMAGFEFLPDTAKYIKSGQINFAVSQNPKGQGYEAVKVLYDFLKHGKKITNVNMPPLLVTSKNVNSVPVE
jgi:simple sugar transport system substrate-binding protein